MAGTNTRTLDEASFDETIASAETPVLVDFWAEWCPPCRILGPIVDEVADGVGDRAIVAKVDVDSNKALAARFAIQSIPTILVFRNGEIVDRFVGVQDADTLIASIDGAAVTSG